MSHEGMANAGLASHDLLVTHIPIRFRGTRSRVRPTLQIAPSRSSSFRPKEWFGIQWEDSEGTAFLRSLRVFQQRLRQPIAHAVERPSGKRVQEEEKRIRESSRREGAEMRRTLDFLCRETYPRSPPVSTCDTGKPGLVLRVRPESLLPMALVISSSLSRSRDAIGSEVKRPRRR